MLSAEPRPADVRAQLDRMLASSVFASSERQLRFLRYVVEETVAGRSGGIKETVIASDVFGRAPSVFDPRTDSSVRVEARNLRARINEYYLTEGRFDPIVIALPRGSYVPQFHLRPGGPPNRAHWLRTIALAALIAAVAGIVWWRIASPPRASSIAVLPFLNLSGGGDDHIADGIVEDLTTDLAEMPGLRVAARTSAFRFRDRNEDVRRIGRELGVATVLEGSVRRNGVTLRVSAQLIETGSGYHLWARTYESGIAEAGETEAGILKAVSAALRVTPGAQTVRNPPPEARDAYWRGRYLLATWQRQGDSLAQFEEAVRRDPQYAEAWSALALARATMVFQHEGPTAQLAIEARDAVQHALALDDASSEAWHARALLDYAYDRDWPTAERSFQRALELNPNSAPVRRAFALALASRGRTREALEQLEEVRRLDPLTLLATNTQGVVLYLGHRYDEAIALARSHLKIEPDYLMANFLIAVCDVEKGKNAEALTEFRKVVAQYRSIQILGRYGNALARAGRESEARAVLAELQTLDKPAGEAGVGLAMVYAGLGDKANAVQALAQGAAAHQTDAAFNAVDPMLAPLHP